MAELFAPVVSVTATKRRRWLWAAWWTAPPTETPFRPPDDAQGGARSREEALRQAEASSGRPLLEIEGRWARAFARGLRGLPQFAARPPRAVLPSRSRPGPASLWQLLGVPPSASADEIRRAFRARALLCHPDQGGDAAAFRDLRGAYDEALRRRARAERRPRRA